MRFLSIDSKVIAKYVMHILKIAKGQTEAVNRRRTDYAKKKKNKRTNNDLQNIHIKLKTEQHEPH
jgi:hypothetical protein